MVAEPGRSTTVVRLLFQDGAEIWIETGHLACLFQDLEEPRLAAVQGEEDRA